MNNSSDRFKIVPPGGFDPSDFLILEVASWRSRAPQSLPGAIQIDPCYVESGGDRSRYYPRYGCAADARLLPLGPLREALRQLGICSTSRVLLTGTGPCFPINAARVAWALLGAGLARVYWLDGGSAAWQGPTAAARLPRPADSFGEALDLRAEGGPQPGQQLADVRTRAEYLGRQCQRYTFFTSCGHLPGALWLRNWTHLMQPGTMRLKPLEQIAADWEQRGLRNDRPVTFYCGTGWRSSLACCVALALGFVEVHNYDGGLYDWVERGGHLVVPT